MSWRIGVVGVGNILQRIDKGVILEELVKNAIKELKAFRISIQGKELDGATVLLGLKHELNIGVPPDQLYTAIGHQFGQAELDSNAIQSIDIFIEKLYSLGIIDQKSWNN